MMVMVLDRGVARRSRFMALAATVAIVLAGAAWSTPASASITVELSSEVADAFKEIKESPKATTRRLQSEFNLGLEELGKTNPDAKALFDSGQKLRIVCFGSKEAQDARLQPGDGLYGGSAETKGDFDANGRPKAGGTTIIAIECAQIRALGLQKRILADDPNSTMYGILIHELLHAANGARRHPPDLLDIYEQFVRDFVAALERARARPRDRRTSSADTVLPGSFPNGALAALPANQAFAIGFNAGLLQVTGAEQGYLGRRFGGVDIFPLQRFRVTQSGQFFGANVALPQFGNGSRLTFDTAFFQTSGSATVAPTSVAGDFTLVPGVTTDGFSFNNIFNLAALGPQNFTTNHRGFAFSTAYEFGDLRPVGKLATNGFSVVPLVYAGVASKETNTRYNTTLPAYDTTVQYRSDVDDQILRGGVGVRLQTTLPVGNFPATFFVQGQIGAAHHRVASREFFDISIFSGAITAAEQASIHGSATGFDWMAKFGANWLCQWPGGTPLQIGVSAFIAGDTAGGITRAYLGGPPVLSFGAKDYWGLTAQARVQF